MGTLLRCVVCVGMHIVAAASGAAVGCSGDVLFLVSPAPGMPWQAEVSLAMHLDFSGESEVAQRVRAGAGRLRRVHRGA